MLYFKQTPQQDLQEKRRHEQDFQDTDKADASLRFAPLVLFKISKILGSSDTALPRGLPKPRRCVRDLIL